MVKSKSTESLIESLHGSRKNKSLVINPDYLDDEKLPGDERTAVLKEIFNRNIREKQLSRIISHLTPILDGAHPPSALIYGPTGSGKTVTLIHVLSTFKKVTKRHGINFQYAYVDLTSPKTYFGAVMLLPQSGRPQEAPQRGAMALGKPRWGYLIVIIKF